MKKSILLTIIFIYLFTHAAKAQENKPEANSFGIQYGISYGGTLNQSLSFSGWLKNGLEIKGGLLLGFTQTDSKSGDTTSIYINQTARISGYNYNETKSGSITITPNISILKHFKTKNNIDPFVGGLVSTGINFQTIQTQSINETTGDNYDRYTNILSKTPIVVTIGVSLVGGVNYFFAKNFAIGVDAGFGFTSAITRGTRYQTSITRNSGSNNTIANNQTSVTAFDTNVSTNTLNLSGNGGLRFTYYIKVKNRAKKDPKI
jgi:hypothetical protein